MNYTPEQLSAINTINNNLQIIACAGSGKTQVISQRVVTILKENPDILPKNIIAFTYTEKAVAICRSTRLKFFIKDDLIKYNRDIVLLEEERNPNFFDL